MAWQDWGAGILSSAGVIAVVKSFFDYKRNRERDKAYASKTRSESIQLDVATMSEGYKNMFAAQLQISAEDTKRFQRMLDEERKECDFKLKEMQMAYDQEINFLKKAIEKLQPKQ